RLGAAQAVPASRAGRPGRIRGPPVLRRCLGERRPVISGRGHHRSAVRSEKPFVAGRSGRTHAAAVQTVRETSCGGGTARPADYPQNGIRAGRAPAVPATLGLPRSRGGPMWITYPVPAETTSVFVVATDRVPAELSSLVPWR